MDVISLIPSPANDLGIIRVEIQVNQTPLIAIIRDLELPNVRDEFKARVATGELDPEVDELESLAGQYSYLNSDRTFAPCRNFLGQPYSHGFRIPPEDSTNLKSLILECTCGITDCWFLLAQITFTDRTVRWTDFQQFHRKWNYGNLSFEFARPQYEQEFNSSGKRGAGTFSVI